MVDAQITMITALQSQLQLRSTTQSPLVCWSPGWLGHDPVCDSGLTTQGMPACVVSRHAELLGQVRKCNCHYGLEQSRHRWDGWRGCEGWNDHAADGGGTLPRTRYWESFHQEMPKAMLNVVVGAQGALCRKSPCSMRHVLVYDSYSGHPVSWTLL